MFKTKTKTFIFVLEAPRDQDPGLEDYITAFLHILYEIISYTKAAANTIIHLTGNPPPPNASKRLSA